MDEDCNGSDLTLPDEYEPNNTATCYYLGEDPNMVILPTTDNPYDTDYFCFDANDSLSSREDQVYLEDQPIGMDNDIFLYKGVDGCEANEPIASSVTIGGQDESLNWGERVSQATMACTSFASSPTKRPIATCPTLLR